MVNYRLIEINFVDVDNIEEALLFQGMIVENGNFVLARKNAKVN